MQNILMVAGYLWNEDVSFLFKKTTNNQTNNTNQNYNAFKDGFGVYQNG